LAKDDYLDNVFIQGEESKWIQMELSIIKFFCKKGKNTIIVQATDKARNIERKTIHVQVK
jgi:hypothetical protein